MDTPVCTNETIWTIIKIIKQMIYVITRFVVDFWTALLKTILCIIASSAIPMTKLINPQTCMDQPESFAMTSPKPYPSAEITATEKSSIVNNFFICSFTSSVPGILRIGFRAVCMRTLYSIIISSANPTQGDVPGCQIRGVDNLEQLLHQTRKMC